MKKKILPFTLIVIPVAFLFVLYTQLQTHSTSDVVSLNEKSNDERPLSATTSPDLPPTEPHTELLSSCEKIPYENNLEYEFPLCDAITSGYYFNGSICAGAYLGCYGVFPFSTLKECQALCESESATKSSSVSPTESGTQAVDVNTTNQNSIIRIHDSNPASTIPGNMVEITYSFTPEPSNLDYSSIRVVLGGNEIIPQTITSTNLHFQVPHNTMEGSMTLFLRANDSESNTLRFTVSKTTSVVAPKDDEWLILEDGSKVSKNLVLLFIADNYDLDLVASAAATTENAEVVGRIDALRARQLRLPTTTFEELESAVKRLEAMTGIEDVIMDFSMENMTDDMYDDFTPY